MKILLTGGSGLIGRHLIPQLLARGHDIIVSTRHPEAARSRLDARVILWHGFDGQRHLNDIDAVINLAGEAIADKRWTTAQKQRLCHSRWDTTQKLVALFNASTHPPSVLLSGSATGYYGDPGEQVMTEEDLPHHSFTHQLCARWEHLACDAQSDHTRVCLLRTGIVLAADGGALAKMVPLFKRGLGGTVGNGRQYLPWIHIADLVNAILWLLDKPLQGPFNLVSPYPAHNEQFSHALARALNRPLFLRIPALLLRAIMGESAIMVLGGQHALPKRLEASGFHFRWYNLDEALSNVLQ